MNDTNPLKPAFLVLREAVMSPPGPDVTSPRGHITFTCEGVALVGGEWVKSK
jgi:hypothetical protein